MRAGERWTWRKCFSEEGGIPSQPQEGIANWLSGMLLGKRVTGEVRDGGREGSQRGEAGASRRRRLLTQIHFMDGERGDILRRRVLVRGSSWVLTCPSSILTRLLWRKLTHVGCLLSVPAVCLMFYILFLFNPQSNPRR